MSRPVIDHDNLEAFSDGVAYDHDDQSDVGVAFYLALARETGGPILEIACGTGRVAIPIAREGFRLIGLDIVPGMLDVARQKSAGLDTTWVEGDARSFKLDEQFRLIFLTGNAFQALVTREEQEALLACAREHLHPDGLLAFETRNPQWRSAGDPNREAPPGFAFLETREGEIDQGTHTDVYGCSIHITNTLVYDHANQILHWDAHRRWIEGGRDHHAIVRTALRFTFPQELEMLLHHAGFELIRRYGDWDLSPLTETSRSIIVVCRKRS
jgi:SAM-dependent methyltransferase